MFCQAWQREAFQQVGFHPCIMCQAKALVHRQANIENIIENAQIKSLLESYKVIVA
jgi:hypothetical protein